MSLTKQILWVSLAFIITCLIASPISAPLVFGVQSNQLKQYSFGQKQKFKVGFNGKEIIVFFQPRPGEGMFRFASWTLRDWRNNYQNIKKYNNYKTLQKNQFVQFPFNVLNNNMQSLVLQTLFNHDSSEEEGWAHRVLYSGETISLIAGVFAKREISSKQLVEVNQLKKGGKILRIGDVINIPWDWVREELNLAPIEAKKPLRVKRDQYGKRYAYYTIQKGESLYSSVVFRFTGRTLAEDVNRMADELLKINSIKDEHYIRVGSEIKIPLAWISEAYLKKETPLPSEKEVVEIAAKQFIQKGEPLHVIIDPGHGGRDPGAVHGTKNSRLRIFEDETVYDISLRLAKILKQQKIQVHLTLDDPNQQNPISQLAIRKDEDERVMVTPPYKVSHVKVGINMRIYLVNSIFNELLKKKVPKNNIILLSLHGDALHKSLEGATVYFPDARLRSEAFGVSHRVYKKRKEFRRKIKFPIRDNSRSALLSSAYGKTIIDAFKKAGLKTHSSFAVRGYYYRKGARTLPGILRYSKIPTSVLVEVGNLNNTSDRAGLQKAEHRQKIAAALANAIKARFSKG